MEKENVKEKVFFFSYEIKSPAMHLLLNGVYFQYNLLMNDTDDRKPNK